MNDLHILAVIVLLDDSVGHEEEQMPFHEAQGLPSSLATFDPILIAQRERICERTSSDRKADAVLLQIALGFGRVPGEAHGWHYGNIIMFLSLRKARRFEPSGPRERICEGRSGHVERAADRRLASATGKGGGDLIELFRIDRSRAATVAPAPSGGRKACHDAFARQCPFILGQRAEQRKQQLAMRRSRVHLLGQ